MKKLIDLFNKKYGDIYGIIDDSIDNEDVYKVYKMIKSLCSDDNEIMDMLNKIELPNPRTASESIEKINAEHVSGGGLDDFTKEELEEKNKISKLGLAMDRFLSSNELSRYGGLNIIENIPDITVMDYTSSFDMKSYNNREKYVITEKKQVDMSNKNHPGEWWAQISITVKDGMTYDYISYNGTITKSKWGSVGDIYLVIINNEALMPVYFFPGWSGDKCANWGDDFGIDEKFRYYFQPYHTNTKKYTGFYQNRCSCYYDTNCKDFTIYIETPYCKTEKEVDEFIEKGANLITDIKTWNIKNSMYSEIAEGTLNTNDKIINYINDLYNEGYELQVDVTLRTDARTSNKYSWYKYTPVKFSKACDCIVDWGDGTIENCKKVTEVSHAYESGLQRIRIYSKEKLPIKSLTADVTYKCDMSGAYGGLYQFNPGVIKCNLGITNKVTSYESGMMYSDYDYSDCDLSGITNLDNGFCPAFFTRIPSSINCSAVTNYDYAFQQCLNLIDVTGLDTSNATTAEGIFLSCHNLADIHQLNFQKCKGLSCAFCECYKLVDIDIINTGLVKTFDDMFYNCDMLETVRTLDISSGVNFNSMFYYCNSLRLVVLTGNATADKINSLIAELPIDETFEGERVLDITTCTNKDAVTATATGWTIKK